MNGKRTAVQTLVQVREVLAEPFHARKENAAPRKVEQLHVRKENHAEPHLAKPLVRLHLARASHAKLQHVKRTEAANAHQAREALPAKHQAQLHVQAKQLVAAQTKLQAVQ